MLSVVSRRSLSILAAVCCVVVLTRAGLAAPVAWTGAGDGVLWQDPANWSSDPALPGPDDDVTISSAVVSAVTHGAGTTTIRSLQCEADLSVTGGSLKVAADSEVSGSMSVSAGIHVIVDGAGSEWVFSGAVSVAGAWLESTNGGGYSAALLTSLSETRLILRGAGATASFPNLSNIDAARLQMYDGATFVLPAGVTSY
ncbi:MAG: hypothetical protein KDA21_04360, partial [Phycisphaerales bacterium]|nr:hypothetical protein [Phycisphaerales bacterium]